VVVLTIDPDDCDAVVFDMDGVLTDTARVHAAAWKDTFDAYLRARAEAHGERFEPFDLERDYPRHVDGKARYDGVRSFLASRGIEIAAGEPSDAPDRETVCGLGNRKNERFLARLREQGAAPFADGVELVSRLRAAGIRTAVISASRNAREVLERAGIGIDDVDLFELNEPFAVQVLTWCDGVGVAPDDPRLNPYGGAIACGHPLAATGVRLLAQLARGFRDRPGSRYGLTALCIGLGMGAAILWENMHNGG